MLDWLMLPVDTSRIHEVVPAIAWHGRFMVLAWGICIPLGILLARYFKVTARQDWPREVDNRFWWHSHLALQYTGGLLMLAGAAMIWAGLQARLPNSVHGMLGSSVLGLGLLQFLSGWLRGSKGGPGEPAMRGDHYDMTRRRHIFERLHKTSGYVALALALAAIVTGLWTANAPRWMWLALALWWAALSILSCVLQAHGKAIGSYLAIWGPDPKHPGNQNL
ncbi:MAG: cytochrome b561 domain-containing protein [Bosea sp. (in: a-proteobacteria)]